jgi:hypothetical protein
MKNDPSAPFQRTVLSERRTTTSRQTGRLVDVIHGFLTPDQSELASLIIFQFHLQPSELGRHIKSVSFRFRFEDMQGRPEYDPKVYNLAPRGIFLLENPLSPDVAEESGSTRRNSLSSSKEPLVTTMTLNGDSFIINRRLGAATAVQWTLEENGLPRDGINYSLLTAVLLRRSNNDCFRAKVDMDVEISGCSVRGIIGKLPRRSSRGEDDPVLFNPSLNPTNNRSVFNIHALGAINLHEYWDVTVQTTTSTRSLKDTVHITDSTGKDQAMWDCARGLYPQVWYKFKRFETLSLLNLYHYQDKLVQLDKKISEARGDMKDEDITNLARLLREYRRFSLVLLEPRPC